MPDCPACLAKRLHSKEDWKNHPLAGHGFYSGQGWSSEQARIAHELDESAREAKARVQ